MTTLDPSTELEIRYQATQNLRPNPKNPRTHTRKQIDQVAASIETFGWTVPILIDAANQVVAGHGRLEAAKQLKLDEVPTICLENLSEPQLRAYALADNRLAEIAGWDDALLSLELGELSTLEIDFDLTITGFETADIDVRIQEIHDSTEFIDTIPTLLPNTVPVSTPGDLWEIGDHLVFCGNALDETSFQQLLGEDRAEMVFTDPPYNVPMQGHASGLGRTSHREFPMACGEMTAPQFTGFLTTIFEHLCNWSIEGSIHFVCMDWRHQLELLTAAQRPYGSPINLCVWAKTNGGMGSLYRSQHELVYVLKKGGASHINNVELGRNGRYRTNLWTYPGVNTFKQDRDAELAMHPTVKPVQMVADALLDCSNRDGVVLDCFGGSGTTLIAAENTGRRARLIELDPLYVDVTLRRYSKLTGVAAVHANSGFTFTELEAQRTAAKKPGAPTANREAQDER